MEYVLYLYTPRLKIARLFAASLILGRAERISLLALPYPKEMEEALEKFVKGLVSWSSFQLRVVNFMGSYGRSWLNLEEPLLLGLKLAFEKNPNLKLLLYGSLEKEDLKYRVVSELAALALRARITGRVDVEEWRRVLSWFRKIPPELQIEARQAVVIIESKSHVPRGAILVEALPGYVESPIEKLFSSRISEQIVGEYVEYILDYLAKYPSIDCAYFKWVKDKGFKGVIAQLSDYYLKMLSAMGER